MFQCACSTYNTYTELYRDKPNVYPYILYTFTIYKYNHNITYIYILQNYYIFSYPSHSSVISNLPGKLENWSRPPKSTALWPVPIASGLWPPPSNVRVWVLQELQVNVTSAAMMHHRYVFEAPWTILVTWGNETYPPGNQHATYPYISHLSREVGKIIHSKVPAIVGWY